jgi:hypothetical protein
MAPAQLQGEPPAERQPAQVRPLQPDRGHEPGQALGEVWDAGSRREVLTMAISEHDRKVGALLGLDPARIAENRRLANEKADAQGLEPLTPERLRKIGTAGHG